jgi:ketosteroid isomerase-like protein
MRGAKIAAGSAAALVALALAACGGDGNGSDEDQVAEAVESFVQAGNEGDAEAACELLTTDLAERIARAGGGDCAKALGDFLGSAEHIETKVRIEEVRVSESRANADVTIFQGDDARQEKVLLVEEDGEWRLADAGF